MDTNEIWICAIVLGLWLLTMWRELRKLREWQRCATATLMKQNDTYKAQVKQIVALTEECNTLRGEVSVARPRNEAEAEDFATWRSLREQYPQGLASMITQAGRLVASAPDLARLKVQCSINMPLLNPQAMSAYLDSLDAQLAIVPGITRERPLEIAVRHENGWVTLVDGFHALSFVHGKMTGVYESSITVPPRETPMVRQRDRIGGPIRRTLDV